MAVEFPKNEAPRAALRPQRRHHVLEILAICLVVIAMGRFIGLQGVNAASYHEQAVTATWYCAGKAVDAHADPYRVEPLRACEIQHYLGRKAPWVEPAPLPGYALAGFGLWARLPFSAARTLWFYVLIASIVGTAIVLAKLSGVRPLIALLCLATVDGYINLIYGELPPIAIAALVAAAAFGSARRYGAAAICGALAMVEPHVALPACCAMFVAWPRTRIPFAVAGIVLGLASIAAVGVAGNVEYFRDVLPVHAAAEIAAGDQFSLTRMLHILGVSDRLALTLGAASYVLMVVLGVVLSPILADRLRCPALVPLYASAIALLGGSFVHDLQIAAAIPAAFLIATRNAPLAGLRSIALVALIVPWALGFSGQVTMLQFAGVAAAVLATSALRVERQRWIGALVAAAACLLLVFGLGRVPGYKIGPAGTPSPLAVRGDDLASANWAAFVTRDRLYTTPTLQDVVEKLPVWIGLICLTAAGVAFAAPFNPVRASLYKARSAIANQERTV